MTMSPWNVPLGFGANTPFSFGSPITSAFNLTGGLGTAGAAGAGAAAGGAGAAGGLLGALGGPIGPALLAGTSILGGIGASNAAEASMQAAKEQAKLGFVSNIAGQRFLTKSAIGDQMRALSDRQSARRAGLYAPEDFQNLLSAGLSPTSARRELYSPIFRGV